MKQVTAPQASRGNPRGSQAARDAQPEQARRARFEELYQLNYDDVYYFILRRIGTVDAPARAAEVTNEAFLTTWRRLDQVPVDAEQARAWLFTVARNCLLHEQRAAARRSALAVRVNDSASLGNGYDIEISPDDNAVQRLDFAAAWRSLSAADQEAIALSAFEELSGAEAAQVLGISIAAYKFRLHTARTNLRKALTATAPAMARNPETILTNGKNKSLTGKSARERAPTPVKQNWVEFA